MIKILALYENYGEEFKIFNFQKKQINKIIGCLSLRSRFTVGRERYFLITDEVSNKCKTDDEIFGLYKTLSEKRRKLFFIEL